MNTVVDEPPLALADDGREDAPSPLGERRAHFEREILTNLDALYAFAVKLARNRHTAEDLVSEAMVRAFDRWEQYVLGTNARAWLFTILYHVFINRLRSERREAPLPEFEDGSLQYEPIGESDPEGAYFDSLIDEEITRAIDALPAHYRAAVVLSDIHGFRYAEIAEILGVPEGTAKSRLFRGRRMLQKKLLRYAVEMGYVKGRAA
jgi:RNA polymerase sigma-70 factor (ECF subfamily)